MHDAPLCKKVPNTSPRQTRAAEQRNAEQKTAKQRNAGQIPAGQGSQAAHRAQEVVCLSLGAESVAAIAELERRCFSLPWTEEQFHRAFEQRAFAVSGIREAGELVAYLSVYHTCDELEILNIAVSSDKRRRGFGRLLLARALHEARKNGIVKAVLEVRPSNTAARGLYEGLGFVQVGLRKRYYPDTGEDALVYVFEMAKA